MNPAHQTVGAVSMWLDRADQADDGLVQAVVRYLYLDAEKALGKGPSNELEDIQDRLKQGQPLAEQPPWRNSLLYSLEVLTGVERARTVTGRVEQVRRSG